MATSTSPLARLVGSFSRHTLKLWIMLNSGLIILIILFLVNLYTLSYHYPQLFPKKMLIFLYTPVDNYVTLGGAL